MYPPNVFLFFSTDIFFVVKYLVLNKGTLCKENAVGLWPLVFCLVMLRNTSLSHNLRTSINKLYVPYKLGSPCSLFYPQSTIERHLESMNLMPTPPIKFIFL